MSESYYCTKNQPYIKAPEGASMLFMNTISSIIPPTNTLPKLSHPQANCLRHLIKSKRMSHNDLLKWTETKVDQDNENRLHSIKYYLSMRWFLLKATEKELFTIIFPKDKKTPLKVKPNKGVNALGF